MNPLSNNGSDCLQATRKEYTLIPAAQETVVADYPPVCCLGWGKELSESSSDKRLADRRTVVKGFRREPLHRGNENGHDRNLEDSLKATGVQLNRTRRYPPCTLTFGILPPYAERSPAPDRGDHLPLDWHPWKCFLPKNCCQNL